MELQGEPDGWITERNKIIPLLHFLIFLEMLVRIIKRIVFPVGFEKLRANSFFHRVPDFDGNKQFTTRCEREELPPETEVTDLAVDLLILNQATDLTVDHSVELGNQDNIIAIFTMLREEGKPFLTALSIPFPGVKHQLTLVNHQQQTALTERMR